jgi:histone H3/H4
MQSNDVDTTEVIEKIDVADTITETVSKKRRRWRNGTVAKRDITRLSKSTHLLLAKRPFHRLIVEISQQFNMDVSFQKKCIESIQESSEAYILEVLLNADLLRQHAHRNTMNEADIQIAVRMTNQARAQ